MLQRSAPDLPAEYVSWALDMGWVDLDTRGDQASALARLDSALARYPWDGMPERDRPYTTVIDYLALAGETGRAQALLTEFERAFPEGEGGETAETLIASRALIATVEGRYEEALRALEPLRGIEACRICQFTPLAMAYRGAGRGAEEREALERYIEIRWFDRLGWDASLLGPALERAAALAEETGDLAVARQYHERLIDLWEYADPELQPRVEASRRRLAEIARAVDESRGDKPHSPPRGEQGLDLLPKMPRYSN